MLNYVAELAVNDGVLVPDAEDNIMDGGYNRTKSVIFSKFWSWYAGDEELNSQKGMGVPTVARVLVAERFERPLVDKDFAVAEGLFSLPQYHTLQASLHTSSHQELERSSSEDSSNSFFHDTSFSADGVDELLSIFKRKNEDADYSFSELVKAYEQAVFTVSGSTIRIALYRRQLDIVLSTRRIGVLKFFWPPVNSNRLCQRFMFPRIGLLVPPFSIPQKRFKLFASKENQGYTLIEMLSWYNDDDADDALMRLAEKEGQKKESYVAWLMRANDRLAEGRQIMEEEDKRSFLLRYYTEIEEKSIAEFSYSRPLEINAEDLQRLYIGISPQWQVSSAIPDVPLKWNLGFMVVAF